MKDNCIPPPAIESVKYQFGHKLRAVRERRGWTLRRVATAAGVSESLVCQIELNRVSPAIDTLLRLAEVLEVDPEHLFSDWRQERSVMVVRADERHKLSLPGVVYERLSRTSGDREHDLEAYYLEISPGGEKGSREYGHVGRELGVILTGKGRFTVGGVTYDLDHGDSISFSSDAPHVLANTGTKPLTAFWVVTPPRGAEE